MGTNIKQKPFTLTQTRIRTWKWVCNPFFQVLVQIPVHVWCEGFCIKSYNLFILVVLVPVQVPVTDSVNRPLLMWVVYVISVVPTVHSQSWSTCEVNLRFYHLFFFNNGAFLALFLVVVVILSAFLFFDILYGICASYFMLRNILAI